MPGYVARWFIEGDVDWDAWNEQLQRAGPLLAGVLFGAGWCCWLDSMIYQAAVVGVRTPIKYQGPGIASTVALVAINLIPRRDLADEAWGEGGEFPARLWLFCSFLIALGAVAGSVAVLVATTSSEGLAGVGVGSVLQSFLILASSLIFWAFRSDGSQGGYGAI